MKYGRKIDTKLTKLCKQYPALILTGARQVGKTTLLKNLFPHHHYVSLDLPSIAEMAETNPEDFFRQHPPPLIVDEVQYAPTLFRYIKKMIDDKRGGPDSFGEFILTGSQKFVLMQEVSDSLAGRCAILNLEGLSLSEIEKIDGKKESIHYLLRGMFPALYNQADLEALPFYQSYIQTYLERDVRKIINISNLRDFERFLRVLATHNGQTLNKSEIARETGITQVTANKWLSILITSNQITLLEPFFINFGKRLAKNPKLYFNDTGLLCTLLGFSNENALINSSFIGHIWEAFVFSELRKQIEQTQSSAQIWFYRDQQQLEVDFIWDCNGILSPIEVKWKENIHPSDFKNILAFNQLMKKNNAYKMGDSFVISRTNTPLSKNMKLDPEDENQEKNKIKIINLDSISKCFL